MAIKLESVARYLESKGVAFKRAENHLVVGVNIETSAGNVEANMVFSAPLEGRVFSAETVGFLPTEVMGKLMESREFALALLNLGWKTPFGACELSSEGDDLRFVVELPLEDAVLSEAQFNTLIHGLKLGTREICELALKVLGKAKGAGGPTLMDKVKAAADIFLSEDSSAEDKQGALDFLVALAGDENAPTQERMAAVKFLNLVKEALEEAKAESSGAKSPFLS